MRQACGCYTRVRDELDFLEEAILWSTDSLTLLMFADLQNQILDRYGRVLRASQTSCITVEMAHCAKIPVSVEIA